MPCEPGDREDHGVGRRIHRGEGDHLRALARSLMPAMPPAGAALRPHLRGRIAQQLGVVRDEDQVLLARAQLGRADDAVAVLEGDDLQLVLVGRVVGHHPLDHALFGADRQARGGLVQRGQADQPSRRPPATGTPRSARRPTGCGADAVSGSCGRSTTMSRSSRPVDVTAPTSPRVVAGTAETITSCLARLAARSKRRFAVGRTGQQPRRGQQHPARVVGDLQRHRRHRARPPTPAAPCGAVGAELLGHRGQFAGDQLAQLGVRVQDPRSAPRSRALSRSRSLSSSIRSNLVSRRSGVSRMYCVWIVAEREALDQRAPWPARSFRWTG